MPVTSRLVFDTTACLHPQQLFDIERLATAAQPLPVADLGWLRMGALRAMFAGMFDPPVGGAPLVHARRITIEHRAGSRRERPAAAVVDRRAARLAPAALGPDLGRRAPI